MKALITFTILIFLSSLNKSFSQDFTVPENYTLKVAEDYTKYEKDIIAAANWLKSVPLNEQKDKRKEVTAFVVNWVNGSPTVNVELNENIFDFEKKNPGMMVIYMASCAKFVLENKYSKDMRAKQKAALKDMIAIYKTGAGIKKDKKMEKLIKSDDAGEIDNWLAENLKVQGH